MTAKRSQASMIAELGLEKSGELFHDPEGVPYALIKGDHVETWRIHSKPFRSWMAGLYWKKYGTTAGSQALTDAQEVLAARGLFDGLERKVGLRIALDGGAIYLDLGDPDWRVVEIDTSGWRILQQSPVPFRRTRGMQALPAPIKGGSLDELRDFLNLADGTDGDDQFRLMAGWLVGAFRYAGPYLVLVLTGEQDSAKSTNARILRLLVDPRHAGDRSTPRDEQTLAVAANNSWAVSIDNVSRLQDWQSDALSRLATGAGFSARALYTDSDEFLVHVARPVILNGIGGIVTRPDLMDRSIVVDLPSIPDDRRRPEEELYAAFEEARPRILGALLTAVAAAWSGEDRVKIRRLPRMADAARWVTAAEGALRWPDRSFLAAYSGNRTGSRAMVLEASPLAAPIRLLLGSTDRWSGTATELLKALEARVDEAVTKRRDWPKTAQLLGVDLRRLAPDLRKVEEIEISFPSRHDGNGRVLSLVRVGNPLSEPSEPSAERSETDNADNADNDLHTRTNGSKAEPDQVAMVRRVFGDDLKPDR